MSTTEGRIDVSSSIRGSVLNSCSSGQLKLTGLVNAVTSFGVRNIREICGLAE